MPAYSYKERFVPFILDGSKGHTIRDRRKNPAKPGDMLYHYFGMRTAFCKKLREDPCLDVRTIIIKTINKRSVVLIFDKRLDDYECDLLRNGKLKTTDFKFLNFWEKDLLAWRDGFRPEGTTAQNPEGSFDFMFRFFSQTHDLPFIGDIIYWIK